MVFDCVYGRSRERLRLAAAWRQHSTISHALGSAIAFLPPRPSSTTMAAGMPGGTGTKVAFTGGKNR
jgi:hypothetical protein